MVTLRWASALAVAGLVAWGSAGVAGAQWQTSIMALRTNGSVMRPGDCLRLDLLTFDQLPGSITPHITYRFTEPVTVKAEDGKETRTTRPVTRSVPVGPVLDQLQPGQRVPLDDTLCFGESTAPGEYQVEVVLRHGAGSATFATLRTCVVYEGTDPAAAGVTGCRLHLRGVKRLESAGTISFDGEFPASGLYKAALIRNHRVEALIDGGVYRSGPNELIINAPELAEAAGGDMDLLLLDGATGWSTTLARLVIPKLN